MAHLARPSLPSTSSVAEGAYVEAHPIHIPNWKGAGPYPQLERGPECITMAPKGVPFFE